MTTERQPHWQPLLMLPLIAQAIDGMLASTQQNHLTLQAALHRPYSLDDYCRFAHKVKKIAHKWARPNIDTAGESPLRGDLSGSRFERREGRNSRFSQRDFSQPVGDAKEIQRDRRQNLLQMRFD